MLQSWRAPDGHDRQVARWLVKPNVSLDIIELLNPGACQHLARWSVREDPAGADKDQ